MEEIQHLGANIDTRPPEEAAKQDVSASETIALAATVEWQEIAQENIRTFGVQNQRGKSDCVAETRRKLKRVMFKVNKGIDLDFSAVAFYRKRVNYPSGGMGAYDTMNIDKNSGMTLDVLVPSDVVTTEREANALNPEAFNDDVAKVFATQDGEIVFRQGDLETISGTIQKTRKAGMVWFFATVEEWSKLVPTIITPLTAPSDPRSQVVHSVAAIEPALYQGQKGMWIDDSAHFGGLSRRFITEDFYKQRNFWASYPMAFKFEGPKTVTRPSHQFNIDLQFSPAYSVNEEVKALQDILKYEGVMPTNVDSTGYFGALTLEAVQKLQIKHGIVAGPSEPGYGRVGPKTRSYLNATYS